MKIIFTCLFCITNLYTYAQWNTVPVTSTMDLNHIAFSSPLTGFIIADQTNNSGLLRTIDGGDTWSNILQGNSVFGINFLNQSEGVILGNDSIFISSNGGLDWTFSQVLTPEEFVGSPLIKMISDSNWFYLRSQRHSITNDKGKTWVETSHGNSGPLPIVIADLQEVNESYIGIGWYSNYVFISNDSAQTWSILNEQLSANFHYSIRYTSPLIAYACGNGGIFKSIDGGLSWNMILPSSDSLNCIRHVSLNVLYAVGNNGLILKTTDAGLTWNTEISGTINNLNKIEILSGNAIISGDSGTILKNNNLPLEIDNQDLNFKLTIYPNPSSSTFVFEIETSRDMSDYSIDIFNSAGQILIANHFSSDQNSTTIDLTKVVNGTYIYKIKSAGQVHKIGKLIKN